MLGDKETLELEAGNLTYSAATKVFYENDELDVCMLVNASDIDLIEGRYIINVFDGIRQIATSTMELK